MMATTAKHAACAYHQAAERLAKTAQQQSQT